MAAPMAKLPTAMAMAASAETLTITQFWFEGVGERLLAPPTLAQVKGMVNNAMQFCSICSLLTVH